MDSHITDKRYILIDYIRRCGSVSRLDISQHFGMNAATVGNAINRLIEQNILQEERGNDKVRSHPGRPKVNLCLNPDAAYYLSIIFSRDFLNVGIADYTGRILTLESMEFDDKVTRNIVIRNILDLSDRILSSSDISRDKIKGIGAGCPGKVDSLKGVCLEYSGLKKWQDVPLSDILSAHFDLPTYIDSSNNCFALGEVFVSHSHHASDIAAILIRNGISMGLIKDRKLYSGALPGSGELGHIIINGKKKCTCGRRGCLETAVSGWVLPGKIKKAAVKSKDSYWLDIINSNKKISPEMVCDLANSGNALASEVLVEMFSHLACALHNVHQVLHLEAFVIHGRFNGAAGLIKKTIEDFFVENKTAMSWNIPEIFIPEDSVSIGLSGAALLPAIKQIPADCEEF